MTTRPRRVLLSQRLQTFPMTDFPFLEKLEEGATESGELGRYPLIHEEANAHFYRDG